MSNKNILDGFVPRRSGSTNRYQAPLTGAPAGLNPKSDGNTNLSKKEQKKLAKAARKSSDISWQNPALKNSVLNSANPTDPLSQEPGDLSEG
jgi:hypothetical protein